MNKIFRNLVTTKAGLTGISGAATTFSTGSAAILYSLDGKAYSKAQVSGGTTPSTDGNTGLPINLTANFGTVVVWALDKDGNVKVYQGDEEALSASGSFNRAPEFPALPDTVAPFAYSVHKAGSTTSGTWTFGSSNWNATGVTHAVQDVMELPSRPQVS
jgi:hypothetical protein